jgi:hypothetical protein
MNKKLFAILILGVFLISLSPIVSSVDIIPSGFNFSVANEETSPEGMTYDDNNFWVIGNVGKRLYQYNSTGIYTGVSIYTGSQVSAPSGATWDGSNFWVIGTTQDRAYKYNSTGSYTGTNFYTGSQDSVPYGITWDGSNFWVVGNINDMVYKYTSAGVYTGTNFSVANEDNTPAGITWDGSNFWVVGISTNRAYQYTSAGVYTGTNFSVANEGSQPRGTVWDGNTFKVVLGSSDTVYEYIKDKELVISLLSPENNTKQIADFINFTSQINLTGAINHINQTIYIWNENDTLFSTNTSFLTGNETIYPSWYLNSFDLGSSYIWNVEACSDDGLCYWGENNRTFTSSVFQKDSEVYDSEIYESESTDFDLNITLRETAIMIIAKLFYNGTEYSGDIVNNGNNTYSISKSLFAPAVTSQENITFYWEICYEYLGDEGCENTTSNIQTINTIPEIELTNNACPAGLFEAINFSFKDEGNDSILNVSMQYNFQYGVDNYSSKMLYGELASTNNFRVCINETLGFYKVGYGEIVYEDANHVSRRFYLYEGQSLSNETTREYNIYDLLRTDATSFIFEVKNTFLNVYADKLLALLRWYPEYNEYRVVEMSETDSDGRTVMKVETEDVDYRIGLYEKDGTLIKLADSVRMACLQDPCTYTMKVVTYDTDYFSSYDVESSLTYDETNKRFLFIWSDSEQKTSLMRLEVFKVAGNQDILICNTTSPSFTGVLSCSTGAYTGTFYAKAYRSASPEKIFDTLYHSITTGIESSFGLFLSAIMVLAVGLIGLFSPVAAIILLIISLVPSLALGAINMSIFMGIATLGGIVIHYIKKSR